MSTTPLHFFLFLVIQTVNVYVSHDGKDESSCGPFENPCRTIRRAITLGIANSQISIMASDTTTRAYNDCPIMVTKPFYFSGIQGIPVIDCEGKEDAFVIAFDREFHTKKKATKLVVMMKSLKIRNAKRAISYETRNKNISFHFSNVTFEGNEIDIKITNCEYCPLSMKGVKASGIAGDGIYLDSCRDVHVTLTNTNFYGKYFKVVSTNHQINLTMQQVTFDMRTRSNASERRACLHIETAPNKTNLAVSSSQFLNHGGKNYGSVYIVTPRKKIRNNAKVSSNMSITLLFEKVTFMNNSASAGNGSAFSFNRQNQTTRAYVKFKSCTFRGNSAFFQGGALWFGTRRAKTVVFMDCKFFGNRADRPGLGQGGALFATGGRLLIRNCRFHGNSATKSGGTLQIVGDTSTIIEDSTFHNSWNNNGIQGGVVYVNESNLRLRGKVIFDLQSANFQQSIFWFKGKVRVLFMSNSTRFICPEGYNYKQLDIGPVEKLEGPYHFFGFNCTACQDFFYSTSRGYHQVNGSNFKGKCQKCPYGASCNGTIRARANFWGVKRGDVITMVPCPRGYCCNREPCPSYNSCRSHRNGTLCGRCEDGFTEGISSTTCRANGQCSTRYAFILICNVALLLVFFLFQQELYTWLAKVLLWKNEVQSVREYRAEVRVESEENSLEGERNSILIPEAQPVNRTPPDYSHIEESKTFNSIGGYVKVFFYFYQVVILVRVSSYSSRSSVANRIIEAMVPFLNFQFANPLSTDCLLQNLTPVAKTFFKNSVCYFVLSLAFLLYLSYKIFRHLSTRWCYWEPCDNTPAFKSKSFPVRLTGAVMQTILLSYVALTHLTATLLNCVEVDGRLVLHIDGSVACYRPFQIFVWLFFVVCITSFPLVLIFGRKLLISGHLSPRRFILACFFPLIFLLYWGFLYYRELQGQPMRPTGEGGRDPFKEKILYILQHPYKAAKSRDTHTWSDRMRDNWESVLIFRRLVIISLFIFVHNSLLRACLLFFVSFVFLMHHVSVQPFANKAVNKFETASLSVLVLFSGLNIAEGSFSTAGQLPPHLVLRIQSIQDVFTAFLPFLLMAGILSRRFLYHFHCLRLRYQSGLNPSPPSKEVEN